MRWVEDNCVGCPQGCINCGRGEFYVFTCDKCGKSSDKDDEFVHEDNGIDFCKECYDKMFSGDLVRLVDANAIIDDLLEAGVDDIEKIVRVINKHETDYDYYRAYVNLLSSTKDGMIQFDDVMKIISKEARWEE